MIEKKGKDVSKTGWFPYSTCLGANQSGNVLDLIDHNLIHVIIREYK